MHYPNQFEVLLLKALRKVFHHHSHNFWYTEALCDYTNQAANDFLYKTIKENDGQGLCIAKFGTVELSTLIDIKCYRRGLNMSDIWRHVRHEIDIDHNFKRHEICHNAGFFPAPADEKLLQHWFDFVMEDIKDIDILASYQKIESEISLDNVKKRINLEGFYAPCLWNNPWTRALENKRVLVVHPFVESISKQYPKRNLIWGNLDVLPKFKSIEFVKAVQSIGGNGAEGFKDWFEALDYMKREIDTHDYDIAIIGCGAYGMHLATHVKRQGGIGIHLAGWTQFLFGVAGIRWLWTPKYAKFINEHWIRPSEKETPKNASSIERGCYW